jgi:hypothetical protein|eukprot:COSAG06_NODE_8575_length_2125_cov_20.123889_4_plen_55_part_00
MALLDDAMEDGFKIACLGLHWRVGSLVGGALVLPFLAALPLVGSAELVWASQVL